MSIIKLSPGNPVTLTVTAARSVAGQFGQQVAFDEGESTLFVSEATALRQLGRIGLDLETCRGETLTFEQVKKDNKTYTNINRASGRPAPQQPQAPNIGVPGWLDDQAAHETQAVAAIQQGDKWATLFAAYDKCLEFVLNVEAPKLQAAGVEVTHEGLSAQTATLLIAAKDRGLAA